LQRFADGDRVGTITVIDQIVEAENRAAETAAKMRSAAKLREMAALKMIMRTKAN